MKKLFSILAAAILMLSLITVPAFAADTPRFYLTGPASASVGDTVELELHVEGTYAASIMNVKVRFDSGSFRYVSAAAGPASAQISSEGGIALYDLTNDNSAVSYGMMMATDPTSAQGVLMRMTFTVLATASANPKFEVAVDSFAYLPLTATQPTDIAFTAQDLTMSVSGGTGPAVTAIPGPGQHTTPDPNDPTQRPGGATPAPAFPTAQPVPGETGVPGSTQAPEATDDPQGAKTNIPDQGQTDVSKTTQQPGEPADPGETQPSGDEPGTSSPKLKGVFIAVIGVLGAALIALIVFFVVRSSKEKNRS